MTKVERGTKRSCTECGAKFYDLNRSPITCPSCGAAYAAETVAPRRAKPAPVAEVEKEEEEPVAKTAPGVEIVSLDEAAAEEAGKADEDELIDLGDDEDVTIEDDDEDVFLEDDEEDGDGVSGIVSSPSKEDEDV
ncbi:MAG: TIGR02300 family protein [Pseudomonadota bacterium]|nr:TIGR02300 family protein [Pseudomonadota bacterium]